MARRSTPQKQIDERAFPVRVRFVVPDRGLGRDLNRLESWLENEVGRYDYAIHSSSGIGMDAVAIYLRDAAGAHAMVAAFPDLPLADGTTSVAYTSPVQASAWRGEYLFGVCNLFSMTRTQDAIRELTKAMVDKTGNLPPLPGIFPDYPAPVVHESEDGRTLAKMRWGMPSPAFALKNRNTDIGVTNVRNTKSPHWLRWLGPSHRCVVPFTSFAENRRRADGKSEPVWFAFDEDRPLAFFAGIWTQWTSVRKLKEGETTNDLFAFLTTDANAEVGAVHPKAMPVILTNEDEIETWLCAEPAEALQLQRPLPDGSLKVVATGEKSDVHPVIG